MSSNLSALPILGFPSYLDLDRHTRVFTSSPILNMVGSVWLCDVVQSLMLSPDTVLSMHLS